jgi:hypothetical protein
MVGRFPFVGMPGIPPWFSPLAFEKGKTKKTGKKENTSHFWLCFWPLVQAQE